MQWGFAGGPMCLVLLASLGQAFEPVGWRTDGSGLYPQAAPPKVWAKDKNVVWCTKLPSWSNASPVLVGEKIFVCAEPATLICLNAADGRILWQKGCSYDDLMTPEEKEKFAAEKKQAEELRKQLFPLDNQLQSLEKQFQALKKKPDADAAAKEELQKKIDELKPKVAEFKKKIGELALNAKYAKPPTEGSNGYTSSSPVSDGRFVYVAYGWGLVLCYDLEGNRQWIKMLDKPIDGYGYCASPLLVGDKLLVQILDLAALDAQDGAIRWRAKVPSSYGSPVRAKIGEEDVAVTAKGSLVRLSDGKVLAEKLGNLTYNSPIVHDGVVYFIQTGGKAFKLPEKLPDPFVKPESLWTTRPKNDRYYSSPVIHDGLLYAINQKSLFSVIDAKTGLVVYDKPLELGAGTVYPSLAVAGNLLYVSSDNGTTLILEAGREYKEVGKNTLEGFRSSPVFQGKFMYLRTRPGSLYCIAE